VFSRYNLIKIIIFLLCIIYNNKMPRLQQERRQLIGYQYPEQVQNDIAKATNARLISDAQGRVFSSNMIGSGLGLPGGGLGLPGSGCCGTQRCGCEQCGSGLMDSIRGALTKGKSLATKASELATGEMGTALRNLLPSSDENARPGFPGEKHAILKLPNGKYGVANYMGPGTHLVERLKRGPDPPRTMSDRVAMAHDIRYGLAKSQADVARADRLMIAKLQDMKKKRQDARQNIEMGLRPIQAKLRAEQFGLVKPGTIASFGDVKEGNRALVAGKLAQLEQEGFGLLPGQMLKMKLIKQNARRARKTTRSKSMKGRGVVGDALKMTGLNKQKVVGMMTKIITDKLLPILLAKISKGSGLRLAGQRGMGIAKPKLQSLLHMRMLRAMNTGASRSRSLPGTPPHLVGKGIIPNVSQMKHMTLAATKTLLPLIIKMVMSKLGLKQAGSGKFVNVMKDGRMQTVFKPSTFERLTAPLNEALFGALKKGLMSLFRPKKGSGMYGAGFFKDFGRGFMKVWNPILKVAKVAAPLAPLLL
jgi:hypothetical protein